MNTSQHFPFEMVSPNFVKEGEYTGFSGTGFFCKIPQHDFFFYVTAKHALMDDEKIEMLGRLDIPYENNSNKRVIFSQILSTSYITKPMDGYEDVIIFVVDKNITEYEKEILSRRAFPLTVPKLVKYLIELQCNGKAKVRTLGFPLNEPNSYIDHETNTAQSQPRGFYGTITDDSPFDNRYGIMNTNWTEGPYDGFSGSPVVSLFDFKGDGKRVDKCLIGLILTGSGQRAEFISINVVTDMILSFLREELPLEDLRKNGVAELIKTERELELMAQEATKMFKDCDEFIRCEVITDHFYGLQVIFKTHEDASSIKDRYNLVGNSNHIRVCDNSLLMTFIRPRN